MDTTRTGVVTTSQRDDRASGGAPAPWRPRPAPGARLDLKTLRMATHGWRLGATVVYKPGARDLVAVGRELASAGLVSGALLVDDTPATGATADNARRAHPDHGEHPAAVRTLLIVRDAPPRSQLGMAVATAVAEVMENALGRPCAVAWPWDVGLRVGDGFARLCRISIELDAGQAVALIGLRFALARLWDARRVARTEGEAPSALFSNEHWREIVLARALHTLDTRLRALMAEPPIPAESAERAALAREWRRRVVAPRRVVIVGADGSRAMGIGTEIAPDGALLTHAASDAAPRRFALDSVAQAWGAGWDAAWAGAHTAG